MIKKLKYLKMKHLFVLKINLLLLLILLTIASCKKSCYSCTTPCIAFVNHSAVYCMDLFESEIDYNQFIDSMLLIKEISFENLSPILVCEGDETKLKYLSHWAYTCTIR